MKISEQYKNVIVGLSVLLLAGVLSGCHASKGLGRDFKQSTDTLGEKIKRTDAWMTENLW